MSIYSLIAVADGLVLAERDFVAACAAAEAGGATCIQIRMKNAVASDVLQVTQAVVARVDIPVFVNDRADIALLGGAHGVHLGADDIPIDAARALRRGARLLIGTSVGDDDEASEARKHAVEYWGVGPVYSTSNKGDAGRAIGCDGLRRIVLTAGDTPVVAIGGITAANAADTIAAGARGVAAIGAIFGSADVERATAQMRAAVDCARA